MAKKKYMRILVCIPDDIGKTFLSSIPNGERSPLISRLIKQYLLDKFPKKKEKSFWDEVKKYRKGDYSHEDPVEIAKHAWDDVD